MVTVICYCLSQTLEHFHILQEFVMQSLWV
jgi:hypothetical protein